MTIQKLSIQNLLLVGFTLFSMFFGAGNLIFPPDLAARAGASGDSGYGRLFDQAQWGFGSGSGCGGLFQEDLKSWRESGREIFRFYLL